MANFTGKILEFFTFSFGAVSLREEGPFFPGSFHCIHTSASAVNQHVTFKIRALAGCVQTQSQCREGGANLQSSCDVFGLKHSPLLREAVTFCQPSDSSS